MCSNRTPLLRLSNAKPTGERHDQDLEGAGDRGVGHPRGVGTDDARIQTDEVKG